MPSLSSNSATPNTSAIKKNGISTDVYDIANYVNEVKKEFTPDVDEDTLLLGTFGYFGAIQSDALQNSTIMASEFANESIATKAKFDKNVISHALNLNITTLNATPARIEVLLTFLEDEIIDAIGGGSGEFIFDRDNKIYFDRFEFHPDYDIIIKRVRLNNGDFTYTAMYRMTGEGVYTNPVSDITNPYLTPPVVMNVNGTSYLFTSCVLRQVEKTTIYKRILSDNTITSKTVNFSFESQLAGFDVDVTNSTDNVHLVPVYEGMDSDSQYSHIWYTYLDTATLRLKFDRDAYSPRINSNIQINLQTTQGEAGNFTWVGDYPQFSFDSDRLGYSNITVQIRPVTGESMYGVNKKSIDELRKIIPREALSRGSITNTKDLKNFFNAIDSDLSQVYLYKKRSNNRDFLYYMYIVMKDALANVIPTNTVNLVVNPDQLFTDVNKSRLIVKKGSILRLSSDGTTAFISSVEKPEEDVIDYTDSFYYIIPYNFAICVDPMYGMYFLTTMDENRSLYFSYINTECLFQYIATSINWKRLYLTDDDTYTLTIEMEQNISNDDSMITVGEGGVIDESNVRCFVVFYNSDNEPYRYLEGQISDYNNSAKIITFTFTMTSEDYIDQYNRIRIDGIYPVGGLSQLINYGYMPANCNAMIHILTRQPEYSTNLKYTDLFYEEVDLSTIIPGLDGWAISNSYTVNNGINFFYNYSDIVYSTISIGDGPFIPPDEPVKPEEPEPPDYDIGGDDIDDDPNDHTLLTEAGLYTAVLKAIDVALAEMPQIGTDETGTLYYKKGDEIIVFGDDDMNITIPENDIPNSGLEDDEITYGEPDEIYEVGGYEIEITPDVYTLATEICVVNTINRAYAKAMEYVHKYGTDDIGSLFIKRGKDIFTLSDDDNLITIPEEDPMPEIVTDDDEHYLTPPTYIIGGPTISDNPDVYTIATEIAAFKLIEQMKQAIISQVTTITVDNETGIGTIFDINKSTVIAQDTFETEPEVPEEGTEDDNETTRVATTNRAVNARLIITNETHKNNNSSSSSGTIKDSGITGETIPDSDVPFHYFIENVPVVKYGYFQTEEMVKYFMDELVRRKNYIDEAVRNLEDLFGINFKFVNTYGPSRLFTLDNSTKYINRVNLTLTFRLGLQVNYDDNILQYITDDIKIYMEDINSIDSIHMSNLVTEITTKYSDSIRFFEFVDMNGYGPSEQHLYSMQMPDDVITPEMVNVNTLLPDQIPDINIIIA